MIKKQQQIKTTGVRLTSTCGKYTKVFQNVNDLIIAQNNPKSPLYLGVIGDVY